MREHPTTARLREFLLGVLSPDEAHEVVAHLLDRCERCRTEVTSLATSLAAPDARSSGAGEGFVTARRAEEGLVERAPAEHCPAEVAALEGSAGAGLEGWGLCEALLERSQALRNEDPERMVALAELAVVAAESLDSARYGEELAADLRCRAWAELANAHRVADDLAPAERAMRRAVGHLKRGTGDPLLLARVMDLTASLTTGQRRFDEAFQLLDRVYVIYKEMGDDHNAGRALISKGLYTGYGNRPQEAIDLLAAGLAAIDCRREPNLALSAVHNMIWFMVDCGRFKEARLLLWHSRPLYALGLGRVQQIKMRWMEGRIAAGLGDLSRGEAAFRRARKEFSEEGLSYLASLASLDLGLVLLRQGHSAETRALVEEMVATFQALGVQREAVAALLLLKEALALDRITLELMQAVSSFLGRLEHDPTLKFEDPG